MVHRLMAGLGAAGVDRVVMMPAGSGVSQSLQRHLSGRTGHLAAQRLPELEVLELALREDARDSTSTRRPWPRPSAASPPRSARPASAPGARRRPRTSTRSGWW
jgi:hypothetical protein